MTIVRNRSRKSGFMHLRELGMVCLFLFFISLSNCTIHVEATIIRDDFPNGLFIAFERNYLYYGDDLVDDTYMILYNVTRRVDGAPNCFNVHKKVIRGGNDWYHPYSERDYIVEYPNCNLFVYENAPLWIDIELLENAEDIVLGSWVYRKSPSGTTEYLLERINSQDEDTIHYDLLGILCYGYFKHYNSDGTTCYEITTTLESSNHESLVEEQIDLTHNEFPLMGLLLIGIVVELAIIDRLLRRRRT